jgi:hypothetical protein
MSPLSMAGALVGDHMCYGSTDISAACDDASYQLGQRGICSCSQFIKLEGIYYSV